MPTVMTFLAGSLVGGVTVICTAGWVGRREARHAPARTPLVLDPDPTDDTALAGDPWIIRQDANRIRIVAFPWVDADTSRMN